VTEYMENGSLDTFLRLHENKLKITQMIKILRDVASGMRYLSDMNYIHRDLAARNILISRDLTCKVADFGLSRAIDNDSLEYTTKGGKIPIRWTAPEACNFRKYSYASDVWSFGVLSYEVLSFGERPYWNWENTDVIKAIHESYRLPPPNLTPDCLYKLMLRCWNDDRLLRPRFIDIVTFLDEIFNCPVELNTPARIKELMPLNPRSPTQIQLTSTKQFLKRIKLEHHYEMFHKNGLANLSNLFQLEAKDLLLQLNVTNTYEQKIILDELKRISDVFLHSVSNQANSYIFFHSNNNNNSHNSFSQRHQQISSIFQLIRTNSLNKNSHQTNDLLQFTTSQQQPLNSNGFLV
jgi:serine/threonine protein kinase